MRWCITVTLPMAGLMGSAAAQYWTYQTSGPLVTDMNVITRYLGQLSSYADNAEAFFGVREVGLPDGCGIEQVHTLQRHAQRFPTSQYDDGDNDVNFAGEVANWTKGSFTGPLSFLNSYQYIMSSSYLTNIGATTEFASGVSFWNKYGRLLFNATAGQVSYNSSFPDGTPRMKPVLRTTGQSRIQNSQINWALGFFGPSFQFTPYPTFSNVTGPFDVVVIPEGGTENNTLAAYDGCFNDWDEPVSDVGDLDLETYLPIYLGEATRRLQQYVPKGFNLNYNDTYAMQSLCAYETAYIGESQFCGLFTLDEWAGFEVTLDTEYYYDYAWGNPTGRAQGIGYVQELLARLTNQYINVSESSVNSTLTDNPTTFPLGEKFYADFSHDDIIVSVLTAMSMDYFKDPPNFKQWPPNPNRRFVLSHITPFGARLITEVIGCSSPKPTAKPDHSTIYSASANGYDAGNAKYKFIRQRLNNGILPLNSIRGGACVGRTDGMCALSDFLKSQENSSKLANYQFACFGNYTVTSAEIKKGYDFDGTISA